MSVDRGSTTLSPAARRQGFVQLLPYIAPLIPLCILVQAIFAGQGMFIDTGQFDIHGGLGSLTLLLALIQAVLVFFAGFHGRGAGIALGVSLALVALIIVQLGLGYSGRDGGNAAAWHVPLGVAIFGMSVGNVSILSRLRSDNNPR
jgi:hypothetical protein